MNLEALLNVFASERAQLESMEFPKDLGLVDEKTMSAVLSARTEKRQQIMSKARREAFLVLSALKRDELIVLAAHFGSVFYRHKYPTKHSIAVEERSRKRREEQHEEIKRNREELMLLRQKARKAKDDRRKGADILHAENRVMKAEVFIWLDAQPKFKSIESAAAAITKQQPITHVTGRAWFKEWKKLRSASTP